jgi:hypothetical protein
MSRARLRRSFRSNRRTWILTALGAALVIAAMVVAVVGRPTAALAHASAWVFPEDTGLLSSSAESQEPQACEGVAGIIFGTDPGWVRVGGATDPSTPFTKVEGQVYKAHVTHTDNSANHVSHDINLYLIPDPDYRHFLTDGDIINEDPDELGFHNHATMENEWEYGGVPIFAYPTPRDRATEWGPLIFDCGHGDNAGPDDEDVYQTEIHPHVGWVLYRHTADADLLPDTPEKRTQDWVWYGPGDLLGAGAAIQSSGGTLSTPLQATIADAFFSSWGGDAPESINGCDSDVEDCQQENEWRTSLLQQEYTFFVPAPPRPAADPIAGEAQLVWESTDHCGEVPSNPGDPLGDDIFQVGEADSLTDPTMVDVGSPTCGTIPDQVVEATDANGTPGIQVTVQATQASYPGNNYIAFAKRYKVGWDFVPADASRARTFQVHFETVRVWRSGDDGDGEWAMLLRANEQTIFPVAGSGEDGEPFYNDSQIDDNDEDCAGDDGDCNDYSINETRTIEVLPGQPINIFSRVVELDDPGCCVFDPNDVLPTTEVDRFGPGSFSSGLASNSDGAYEIFYTITDVTKPSPSAGSLTIGTPQYGPNADTGGVTRVSGLTPLTVDGSDGAKLEYRTAPSDQSLPATWQFDTSAPFGISLAGNPDGNVKIQYAPVSADDIVRERQSAIVQLDTTAPVLDLPDPITVYADQTAGKVVDYTATATDNFPGPVDFSCDHPSGSLFPNGKNAPLTTTVTCTATDAVENTSTGSFTVTVVSPFGYIADFVVLGHDWASLASGTVVQSGNVGAFDQSVGVPNQAGFEIVAGPSAQFQGGSQIAAHSDRIEATTQAGDVFYVDMVTGGNGAVFTPKIGYVPLFFDMPAVPSFSAGTTNLNLSGTQSLPAGSYGKLTVSPNANVTLTGGNYYFSGIEVKAGARVRFSAASALHVAGRVLISNGAQVAPTAASGVVPHDVIVYATGANGPPNKPADAIAIGSQATIGLNAYAPNGTLSIGSFTAATGAFVAKQVVVAGNVTLNEDSIFVCP